MRKATTNQTPKQPRRVEVKLLVPYAFIALMIVGGIAFVSGWHTNQAYEQSIDAAYDRGLASKDQ